MFVAHQAATWGPAWALGQINLTHYMNYDATEVVIKTASTKCK